MKSPEVLRGICGLYLRRLRKNPSFEETVSRIASPIDRPAVEAGAAVAMATEHVRRASRKGVVPDVSDLLATIPDPRGKSLVHFREQAEKGFEKRHTFKRLSEDRLGALPVRVIEAIGVPKEVRFNPEFEGPFTRGAQLVIKSLYPAEKDQSTPNKKSDKRR